MEIDKKELLRYLGWKGQETDEQLYKKIEDAAKRCLDFATPRSVVKKFTLNEDFSLGETGFILQGKDIRAHLQGCFEVYLMAFTLGSAVERETARLSVTSMTEALLFDTAASCAIESYCDDICIDLENSCKKSLTPRFSCGYGDFPLESQKDICRILETQKRIGLIADENFLLNPRKSVTALAGITASPAKKGQGCYGKCAGCNKNDCQFRKQ